MPPVALCQLAFPHTTFEQDVEIATDVGAAGLSVFEPKVSADGVAGDVAMMERAGLSTALAIPELWTILHAPSKMLEGQPTEPRQRVERIGAAIETLAAFRPHAVMLCTGPAGDLDEDAAHATIVEATAELAAVAREHGTKLAIEPMRESYRGVRTIVSSLRETLDLLDEVGRDDVGIVFDIWHLWDSPGVREDLPDAVERIDAVQVSDYRVPTRGRMDRTLAGAGAADVAHLLGELRKAGFEGWYDLELFSDDGRFGDAYPDSFWKLDPGEFARLQLEAFYACWE